MSLIWEGHIIIFVIDLQLQAEIELVKEQKRNLDALVPPQGAQNQASTVLQAQLLEQKMSVLRKRASAMGCDPVAIEEARDSDRPKAAMVELIDSHLH
eukprot:SAG31_NODE_15998_length_728_cov_0.732909_1_plen_97_part_10